LDTFFDIFRQSAGQAVSGALHQVADAMLPTCCTCGERAYLAAPCIRCGRYSCHIDGFFNIVTRTSICSDCADEVDTGAAARVQAEREQEEPTREDYPWCVLNIDPTMDRSEVNRAYRVLARTYHPDQAKDNPHAAEAFGMLTRAKDDALEMIQAAGG
jgi:hypothetical protein